MTAHWTLFRLTPIVASLLWHVVMVPKFVAVREPVLIADLVEPDPMPPARRLSAPRRLHTAAGSIPDGCAWP